VSAGLIHIPLSYDELRDLDRVEERSDLEIAKTPLTGFELDEVERIDLGTNTNFARSLIFGAQT
jgi:hypothetical protein